jgi:predicted DNA-binding protein
MQVRVPDELIERIDALRGLIPRETYIRQVLLEVIEQLEQDAKKTRRQQRGADR